MKRGCAAVATALACLAISLHAPQQARQPVPRFRTGVDLVVLDVSVLDEKRMPVRGLSAEDFTILEDGRPQKIETFSAVDLPDVVRDVHQAAWVRDVAPDVRSNADSAEQRVVVVVLDDSTPMEAVEGLWVKRMAHSVIDQLGPTDLTAVVYTWEKRKGQEFTQDHARLRTSVDKFLGAIPGAAGPSAFDRSADYGSTHSTLVGICLTLANLPQRRKTIVFVSPGVPITFDVAQPRVISLDEPAAATDSGAARGVIEELQDLIAAAQRANVNIYGIDPGGLRAPASRYDALTGRTSLNLSPNRDGIEFLRTLSQDTGGFAVVETNDYQSGVTQVFRENGSYYLLGYAASNRREQGRFRKIEVRVNRPGATVRARTGYYEPLPEKTVKKAKPAPVPAAVDLALAGIVPKSDLRLQVVATPFATSGRRNAAVAVIMGTQQRAPARATRLTQQIDLRVAAFTPDGRQRASRRQKVPITLNTVGFGGNIGYEILTRLELAPGRYYLRLAAESSLHGIQLAPRAPAVALVAPNEDTTTKSGSVYCDLDVPDFLNDDVSLSGVVLSVTPGVVSGPKDALASIVPVVPTTMREFGNEDQVTAFLRAYQGGKGALVPVTLEARILDALDAKVFETVDTLPAERFAKARAADCLRDLPIATLKPGPHLLIIEAKGRNRTVRRDVRFEVR